MIHIENLSRITEETVDDQYLVGAFDQYYLSIYRFIYRHLVDKETSKELTSEVFQRLVKTSKKKKMNKSQVSPWLYRTAHNLLVDHYRKQSHRNHLPLDSSRL